MTRRERQGGADACGASFDILQSVRQARRMTTNVRTFLREFSACKTRALLGETIIIRDRKDEYVFSLKSKRRQGILGCAKGKIIIKADLTQPTLPDEFWNPSLPE